MGEGGQRYRRYQTTEVCFQDDYNPGMPRLVTKLCHNMLSGKDESTSIRKFVSKSDIEEKVLTAVRNCKSRAWGLFLSKTHLPSRGYRLPPRDAMAAAGFKLAIRGETTKAEKLDECFTKLNKEGSPPEHLEEILSFLLLLQGSSPCVETRRPAEVGDCINWH